MCLGICLSLSFSKNVTARKRGEEGEEGRERKKIKKRSRMRNGNEKSEIYEIGTLNKNGTEERNDERTNNQKPI